MNVFREVNQKYFSVHGQTNKADLRFAFNLLAAVYDSDAPETIDRAKQILSSYGEDSSLVREAIAFVERQRG